MGTSSSFGGPGSGTPLVPTWLEPLCPADDPVADPGVEPDQPPTGQDPAPVPPAPQAPASNRFQSARRSFNSFAASGGRDRGRLGRALSGYVSTASGGARNASRRMGSSRAAGAGLLGFLSTARDRGVREALRALDLEGLAGRPIEEIFLGLMDYVCPVGGGVDDGIARDAFVETIADLAEAGVSSLDGLTAEQMETVFELYTAHSIECRIYNDIGVKGVMLPADADTVIRIQEQVHDFIRRAVSDALSRFRGAVDALTPGRVAGFVGDVYEASFEILRALGESEAAA